MTSKVFQTCESSWFLEERVRSSFSLVSPLSNVWADFSVLHCAEENCELYVSFCLSCSRVDSSEDVIHQHRVKGGNDLARHKLYLALYCSLMSLKTEAQKEVFEFLKIAHDKFTWIGRKYHA